MNLTFDDFLLSKVTCKYCEIPQCFTKNIGTRGLWQCLPNVIVLKYFMESQRSSTVDTSQRCYARFRNFASIPHSTAAAKVFTVTFSK